jgi:uncharacterized membrane protein
MATFRLEKTDRSRLRAAIAAFEGRTSAELRILIARKAKGDPIAFAARQFRRLGLTKTKLRNAVLVCVLTNQRQVAVLGDGGIHSVVPEGTWERIVERVVSEFREGRFYQGLANAVEDVGSLLAEHFPHQRDDVNELPDEIVEMDSHEG